ncbi:MAG TPA: helix-turn-helix transcriptional regulator [bacterium]|jgi:transcriptional regulator with XRE-family HTH domain|nr:helix-turn-helix transcriptional regulator [bacterium]
MPNRITRELQARLTGNIHRLLARKRWSAEYIHRHSDVDKGNLSRYFNGHRDYTLLSLTRIAEVLQVDVIELFRPMKPRRARAHAPKNSRA